MSHVLWAGSRNAWLLALAGTLTTTWRELFMQTKARPAFGY